MTFLERMVLVTGATSGIGAGIAKAFADAGATVIGAGLADQIESAPQIDGVIWKALDITEQAGVDALVRGLERLDVLVNAAGIIRRDDEFRMPDFQQVLDVNLAGTMRMCVAARPLLAASKGSIVNIASMLTFFGGARVPAYSASKGGVGQLTKALAAAWAGEGIRVNAVAPGWIATAFTKALREDAARSAAILARTPMGRWGTAEDVAGPVLFLCSEAAGFVTGAILTVDGGYSAV